MFFEEHGHSLTLSTGYPCALSMIFPPGTPDNSVTMDGWKTGTHYKSWYPAGLNLIYNYQGSRHWEISLAVSVSGWFYSTYQYPEKQSAEMDQGKVFDYDATPEKHTAFDFRGIIPSIHFRYYWLARKEAYQMYSGAGLGIMPAAHPMMVVPSITPVGIRFGKRHWFGLAELTLGATGTGPVLGAGYRF